MQTKLGCILSAKTASSIIVGRFGKYCGRFRRRSAFVLELSRCRKPAFDGPSELPEQRLWQSRERSGNFKYGSVCFNCSPTASRIFERILKKNKKRMEFSARLGILKRMTSSCCCKWTRRKLRVMPYIALVFLIFTRMISVIYIIQGRQITRVDISGHFNNPQSRDVYSQQQLQF